MRPHRRRLEAVIAGLALALIAPLFAVIAIAICIADRGSVFYIADRVGLRGARFRMYKFRTMYENSSGSRIAAPGDPRIFRLGQLLRRLRLDELPQLINIVRGDMAFVGPRPEDPWIVDNLYSAADRETLEVLPGLTSPGTLYYCMHVERRLDHRNTEAVYITGPLRRKLELDRAYMRVASVSSDIRLAFDTLAVVANLMKKRGAQNELTA
jgi:lipopolysaccharide/colanic/teichoic acid biosynthesis glycosyltransferase